MNGESVTRKSTTYTHVPPPQSITSAIKTVHTPESLPLTQPEIVLGDANHALGEALVRRIKTFSRTRGSL